MRLRIFTSLSLAIAGAAVGIAQNATAPPPRRSNSRGPRFEPKRISYGSMRTRLAMASRYWT